MNSERQALYDRGLAACDERHPLNDAGSRTMTNGRRTMTKADILVIVGEQAARIEALERVRLAAQDVDLILYMGDGNGNDAHCQQVLHEALDGQQGGE